MTLIRFEPLSGAAAFLEGTETLLAALAAITQGWPGSRLASDGGTPLFTVRRQRRAFRIDAPWLDEPIFEPSPFRAAANIAVDLVEAYLDENPSLLSLHCAAAEFGGRLVVFPSRAKAGKSTLSARLAAAGIPILTDDLLVLTGPDDRLGMSLGLSVRLRLPLPKGASGEFRAFVADHAGPSDADYLYLDLLDGRGPRFGRTSPVGAVVLLERAAAGAAIIAPASRGDGLQELIVQNLSLGVGTSDAVRRMRRLVEDLPCLAFSYSDLDQGCEALLELFRDWEALATPAAGEDVVSAPGSGERPVLGLDGEPRYKAKPQVALHAVEGGRFLVCEQSDCVYRLNDVSFGLWNLVEEPTGAAEAAAILHGAFPDIDRATIDRDVQAFFADLVARDLIRPA